MNDINVLLLRRLDLNNLAVLYTLLETRSVSASAAQLCLGQPAVSHILKRLRETLGDELLCRHGREMVLTPLAESLKLPLAHWLAQGQALLRPCDRFDPASARGTFRLAMPDLLEAVLLPDLIADLQRSAPGLALSVEAMPSGSVEAALESGGIDGAIGYFPRETPRLARERLFPSRLVCFYHPSRLSLPDELPLATLADYPHIFPSYAGESAGLVDTRLAEHGLSRRIVASTASLLAMPAILARLPTVAVLPDMIATALADRGHTLRRARIAGEKLTLTIELLWHPRMRNDPLHRFIRAAIAETATPT
ncbi:LysR family transcriptional regulator [Paludibacterium paludis]|uniref:LysR family transcriptional regulator n=1 Tax=Paludibacterium paludis TaxID=1225769 RepID=A0A918P6E0_9NEIS|nr:LysR family transcriptional regulator [Paludibacterium paludis]GGY25407.1 LysR family transcriptional regulator [Paludibacterium paludis]